MTLRNLINAPNILLAPGIYDGLSALIAKQSGAQAIYLSGASLAYARFGSPDIGLVSMSEVADTIAVIRERVDTPMIVDADTGFGNALNVQRTVKKFERMGANAIQLEDQTLPKRCGHLEGKSLILENEMIGKIKAALDARKSEDTLIIARTDAVAVEGFERAIERAKSYQEAGADILFIEALKDKEQMQKTNALFKDMPLLVNMVEGGKTPSMNAQEFQELGFSIVIFPGGAVRAIAHTAQQYYQSLLDHGTNQPFAENMFDFDGLNQILGTKAIIANGKKYGE